MERPTNPDLQAALDALPMPTSEPFIVETLPADGWVYKDVPTWFSEEYWDKFLTSGRRPISHHGGVIPNN